MAYSRYIKVIFNQNNAVVSIIYFLSISFAVIIKFKFVMFMQLLTELMKMCSLTHCQILGCCGLTQWTQVMAMVHLLVQVVETVTISPASAQFQGQVWSNCLIVLWTLNPLTDWLLMIYWGFVCAENELNY